MRSYLRRRPVRLLRAERSVLLGATRRTGSGAIHLHGVQSPSRLPGSGVGAGRGLGCMGRCHLLGWPAIPSPPRTGSAPSDRSRSRTRGRCRRTLATGPLGMTSLVNTRSLSMNKAPAGNPGRCTFEFWRLFVQRASMLRSDPGLAGWRSLARALASIWRIRSRVSSKCRPTSSSVRGTPLSRP